MSRKLGDIPTKDVFDSDPLYRKLLKCNEKKIAEFNTETGPQETPHQSRDP